MTGQTHVKALLFGITIWSVMSQAVWAGDFPPRADSTGVAIRYNGSILIPDHPLLLREKGRPSWERIARLPIRLIELPFTVMGYGLGHGLNVIETHHVITKVQQIQPWLDHRHILVTNGAQGDGSGFGVAVGLQGVLGQPRPVKIIVSSALTYRGYQTHALHLQFPGVIGSRGDVGGWVQYRVRPQENFFGLGADAPDSLQTRFQQSNLNTGLAVSYRPHRFRLSGVIDWTTFEVENGAGPYPSTADRFPELPGLNGVTLLGIGVDITYPEKLYPGKPGPERGANVSAYTYWDMDGARYGFNRYSLTLYQTVPILWGDRVLAFRFVGSMTDPRGHQQVPFFAMSTLGGSSTLRGYPDLRFWDRHALLFTAEYRYPLWDISHQSTMAADVVWFVDTGVVYHTVDEVSFGDLVTDYGAGLRFRTNRGIHVRLNVAHSAEATRISVKLGSDF